MKKDKKGFATATCFVCGERVSKRKTLLHGRDGRICRTCWGSIRKKTTDLKLTRAEQLKYGGACLQNKALADAMMRMRSERKKKKVEEGSAQEKTQHRD